VQVERSSDGCHLADLHGSFSVVGLAVGFVPIGKVQTSSIMQALSHCSKKALQQLSMVVCK
jgi:hypothetical protein